MLRAILIAVLLAATPAHAVEPASPASAATAPAVETVIEAPAAAEAAATYDVPTPAPGDAPSSPTILDAYGDVVVTGSVGAPSPGTAYPIAGPASVCLAPHGACALPPVTGPGQVCECFTFGIGSEQGITR